MTTTSLRPAATPTRRRRDWWIPASLIALTFVPALAGALRLVDLSSGRTEENARFFDLPAPIIVHIIGATTFTELGAFQFMPSLRRRRPRWHRLAGRILVPAGLAAALSGMWMAAFADLPVYDNTALMWHGTVAQALVGMALVRWLPAWMGS